MSEQYQSQSRERSSTEFETGAYIALRQSNLASVEVGHARLDTAAAYEQQQSMERTETEMDLLQARSRRVVQMRQAEFELAA